MIDLLSYAFRNILFVLAELDRNRSRGEEGKLSPSDHAPRVIDIARLGYPFDLRRVHELAYSLFPTSGLYGPCHSIRRLTWPFRFARLTYAASAVRYKPLVCKAST